MAETLAARIAAEGPIPLADYMSAANAHYYAARDPLGQAGDFTTAPEISQMFGELVGVWFADLWHRAGAPEEAIYVELGPGRGTLAADAVRAMTKAGFAPDVHLIETSPALRAAQAAHISEAVWHETVATLPDDAPLLVIANEFFDALPLRQFVATRQGWRERLVACGADGFTPMIGETDVAAEIPAALRRARPGSIVELCPSARAIAGQLFGRIAAQGGAALVVDYGYAGPAIGDTFQAVSRHAFANPFADPGTRDLTAHVDFTALADAAEGLRVTGPIGQGAWLCRLGIAARAAALSSRSPDRSDEVDAAMHRLTDPEQMGTLFKVLALSAPDWPAPAGFDD